MPKKTDRRIQRTRALLQDALLAMIIEKGFEATTVQDITDRANVGRATFYAHFADKEGLLLSGLADLQTTLKQQQARHWQETAPSGRRGFGFSLAMLEHARDHWKLYQAMAGRASGSIVLQHLQVILTDLVRDELKALGFKASTGEREMVAGYLTGAFMGTMMWWLQHGEGLSPPEVDGMFRRLVMQGLTAELRREAQTRA